MQDARLMQAAALERLDAGDIRDAAEKSWCWPEPVNWRNQFLARLRCWGDCPPLTTTCGPLRFADATMHGKATCTASASTSASAIPLTIPPVSLERPAPMLTTWSGNACQQFHGLPCLSLMSKAKASMFTASRQSRIHREGATVFEVQPLATISFRTVKLADVSFAADAARCTKRTALSLAICYLRAVMPWKTPPYRIST